MPDRGNATEYKSSKSIRFRDYFSVFVVVGLVFSGIAVILAEAFFAGRDEMLAAAYIGALVCSLIATWIINLLFYKITIRVTDEEITFLRWGRVYRTLSFDKYEFSPKAEVESFFFVPWAKQLFLCADFKDSGKRKRYLCFAFSQKTFDELNVDVLERVYKRGLAKHELEVVKIHVSRKKGLRPYIKRLFVCLIPSVLVAGPLSVLLFFLVMEGALTGIMVFSGILLLIILICVFWAVLPFYRAYKSIPRQITVFPYHIEIDGERFLYKNIRTLKYTGPCERAKTVRELVIEDSRGVFRFTFGRNSAKDSALSTEDFVFLGTRLSEFIT